MTNALMNLAISRTLPVLDRLQRLSFHASKLRWKLHWRQFGLSYRGSADDIFIVSYPKSGTTLLQMLMYQLLTDGQLEFKHITEFSPFLEMELPKFTAPGTDVISTFPRPHITKSHLEHALIPGGPGKYIYAMRSGLDVAVSLYHQHNRRSIWAGGSLEAIFGTILQGDAVSPSWSDHVADWTRNERGLNVLYVSYEDLIRDLPAQARRVADFCGIRVAEHTWPRVCANCSFEFMRQHESKLDPWSPRADVDEEDTHFIRRGAVGGWRGFVDARLLAQFRAQCDAKFAGLPVPGYLHGEGAGEPSTTTPRAGSVRAPEASAGSL